MSSPSPSNTSLDAEFFDADDALSTTRHEEQPPIALGFEAQGGGGGGEGEGEEGEGEQRGGMEEEEERPLFDVIQTPSSPSFLSKPSSLVNDDSDASAVGFEAQGMEGGGEAVGVEGLGGVGRRGLGSSFSSSFSPSPPLPPPPPPPHQSLPLPQSHHHPPPQLSPPIRSNRTQPSNYRGNGNGGDALDPELLALLRNAGGGGGGGGGGGKKGGKDDEKGGKGNGAGAGGTDEQEIGGSGTTRGGKWDKKRPGNDDKVDRSKNGGDAKDEELLKLLKGISSGDKVVVAVQQQQQQAPATTTTTTAEGEEHDALTPSSSLATTIAPPLGGRRAAAAFDEDRALGGGGGGGVGVGFLLPDADEQESGLTDANAGGVGLSFDVTSGNWKERKFSFEAILSTLSSLLAASDDDGGGDDETNASQQSLSALVVSPPGCPLATLDVAGGLVSYLHDGNAAALDVALDVARVSFLLSDRDAEKKKRGGEQQPQQQQRTGATMPEAGELAAAIIKGGALAAASRPATLGKAAALLRTLAAPRPAAASSSSQQSESPHARLRSVAEVLLSEAARPKAPPKATLNVLDSILSLGRDYGERNLPLLKLGVCCAALSASADGKVRDKTIELLAAVINAFGGREDAVKDACEKLKTAQRAQLDKAVKELGARDKEGKEGDKALMMPQQQQQGRAPSAAAVNAAQGKDDVLAMLEEERARLKRDELAQREALDFVKALGKTDFKARIAESKWSEKVAALETFVQAAGPRPCKLVRSGAADYKEIVSIVKACLTHTHYLVCQNAMLCLEVLYEGCGDSLASVCRGLLPVLLDRAKDKKLSAAVGRCLDKSFGTCLDESDVCESLAQAALDKNADKRSAAWQWVLRSLTRGPAAGPRAGRLEGDVATRLARLAVAGLAQEPDAEARKDVAGVVQALRHYGGDEKVRKCCGVVVAELQASNPKLYAMLMADKAATGGPASAAAAAAAAVTAAAPAAAPTKPPSAAEDRPKKALAAGGASATAPAAAAAQKSAASGADGGAAAAAAAADNDQTALPYEEAVAVLAQCSIPKFDDSLDLDGVKACLESTNWQKKKAALDALNSFVTSNGATIPPLIPSFLSVIKHVTKGFKESNFNVMKAALELLCAIVRTHSSGGSPIPSSMARLAVHNAVENLSDKKLSQPSSDLLIAVLTAGGAKSAKMVLSVASSTVDKIKAPAGHEAFLTWCVDTFMASDFGKKLNTESLKVFCDIIVAEIASTNPKVKSSALSLVGALHKQVGTPFKSTLTSASSKLPPATIQQFEDSFKSNPFAPETAKATAADSASGAADDLDAGEGQFDVPRNDLFANLSKDILAKVSSLEGKTAWKTRQEAIEEVGAELKKCAFLIQTKANVADLLRALKERMNDSQSNLKPVAASLIADIVSSLDAVSSAKYFKLVNSVLISAAMNENKKPMRDAAFAALQKCMNLSEAAGLSGVNKASVETCIGPLTEHLKDGDGKSVALSEILIFFAERASHLAKYDHSNSKLQQQEYAFAMELLKCLTSAKADARSSAELLLKSCLESEFLSKDSLKRNLVRLLPAQQRDVSGVVNKLIAGLDSTMGSTKPAVAVVAKKAEQVVPPAPAPAVALEVKKEQSTPVKSSTLKEPVLFSPKTVSLAVPKTTDGFSVGISTTHPLFGGCSTSNPNFTSKETRMSNGFRKKENWPEFPEAPKPELLQTVLKKTWVPLVPASASSILFPVNMKKQDDGVTGCELISKAVEFERVKGAETSHVMEQLDLILKWLSCVVCTKDNAGGLESILDVTIDLFSFVASRGEQLSEAEANFLLPHLIERSGAKGRFQAQYTSLFSGVQRVFNSKNYGALCVSIVELSKNQKARAAALDEFIRCVEDGGVSVLNKKGLAVLVKCLDDAISEVRISALDVIEVVVAKLGGDKAKFFKMCGDTLSSRGQSLVLERVKRSVPGAATSVSSSVSSASVSELRASSSAPLAAAASSPANKGPNAAVSELDLKLGSQSMLTSPLKTVDLIEDGIASSSGPFRFDDAKVPSFASTPVNAGRQKFNGEIKFESSPPAAAVAPPKSSTFESLSNVSTTSSAASSKALAAPAAVVADVAPVQSQADDDFAGPAASLRARLAAIRGKSRSSSTAATLAAIENANAAVNAIEILPPAKASKSPPSSPKRSSNSPAPTSSLRQSANSVLRSSQDSTASMTSDVPPAAAADLTPRVATPSAAKESIAALLDGMPYSFTDVTTNIANLLTAPLPLSEDSPTFQNGKEALKIVHAALTTPNEEQFEEVYRAISSDTSKNILLLTEVLTFSFRCARDGICVPILSVTLACFMAIFRGKFSKNIDQPSFEILVRECCVGLLDARLNGSGGLGEAAADAAQALVRAINKLTIQCAISASRNISLQGLLALYIRLVNEKDSKTAKIVTKLVARVIKAETSAAGFESFGLGAKNDSSFDLEAALCAIEDFFVECGKFAEMDVEAYNEAKALGKSLLNGIVQGGEDVAAREARIREILIVDLEFGDSSLTVAMLNGSLAVPASVTAPVEVPPPPPPPVASPQRSSPQRKATAGVRSPPPSPMRTGSTITSRATSEAVEEDDKLMQLVTEVGGASGDGDAEASQVAALAQYCKDKNIGNAALATRLEETGALSERFKTFILDGVAKVTSSKQQLGDESKENRSKELGESTPGKNSGGSFLGGVLGMRDRLQSLKSKVDFKLGSPQPAVAAAELAADEKLGAAANVAVPQKTISGGGALALRARLNAKLAKSAAANVE